MVRSQMLEIMSFRKPLVISKTFRPKKPLKVKNLRTNFPEWNAKAEKIVN